MINVCSRILIPQVGRKFGLKKVSEAKLSLRSNSATPTDPTKARQRR